MSASDCVFLISSLIEYPFQSINDIEVEDDDFLEDDNYNKLMEKIYKNDKSNTISNLEINENSDIKSKQLNNLLSKKL